MRISASICLLLLTAGSSLAATLECARGWSPSSTGISTPTAEALGLDAAIEGALAAVGVTPGLAVGILREGEVVYARGFGVRDLETCAPVGPDSVFYLLSVTKSFTGMAAAVLHEEGLLELDAPLSELLPEASATPPIRLDQTSLRDLLTHRPGFFNGAVNFRSFLPANLDLASLLHVLEHHSRPTDSRYAYRNTGYVVAAAAIEHATGIAWRDLLRDRIFTPLGMRSSTPSIESARRGEFAYPYSVSAERGFLPAMVKREEQMHAAGGSCSSVTDLLRWLEANLENGKIDGERVLPELVVRQAHAPQIQYDWRFGRYRRFAYGLGVHNSLLDDELVLHHFGGPIHVSFAPRRRLGLVLLSAGPDSTGFVHGLAASLYDLVLAKPGAREGLAATIEEARGRLEDRLAARREREANYRSRRRPLARSTDAYSGAYTSDRLGDMVVSRAGTDEELLLRYGVLSIPLVPLERDVFLVRWPDGDVDEFRFRPWEDGRPTAIDWGGRIFERRSGDP